MTTAIGSYATAALLKARAGISDTTDDTVLGAICDQINQYIETKTGRVLAPVSSATFYLDGDGEDCLYFPRGLRAVTYLGVALVDQPDAGTGTYVEIVAADYHLRPVSTDRRPGWPATRIELSESNRTSGYGYFPEGYNTVKLTATTGWAAVPDDITELALTAALRAWHAVQSGQSDVTGTDDMGRPLVSRFFSARDLETLRIYGVDLP